VVPLASDEFDTVLIVSGILYVVEGAFEFSFKKSIEQEWADKKKWLQKQGCVNIINGADVMFASLEDAMAFTLTFGGTLKEKDYGGEDSEE
jgi:uncharacterized membrane protein HdeD (DUF308 family)